MKVVLGIKLYTLREVGMLLGVLPQTVSKYATEGRIKSRVIGGAKYVSEGSLKDFLLSTDETPTNDRLEMNEQKTPNSCSFKDIVPACAGLKQLPETFRMGRDAYFQLATVKRNLFTGLEERGGVIISGLEEKVSKTDFMAFCIAVTQTLYNQSYQFGNLKENSGISQTISTNLTSVMSKNVYVGDIAVTLNDLCRYGYGETDPTARQRKAMTAIIETLHNTPVVIKYPNGITEKGKLCTTTARYNRGKDGAVTYHLHLSPIFCSNASRNFGELPQNVIKRIRAVTKKLTEAHYVLAELLGIQKKGSTLVRHIPNLVDGLGLLAVYKKSKGQTEKQLLSLFDTMQAARLITNYEVEYTTLRGKKRMSKVSFNIATRAQMLEAPKGNKG